MTLPPMTLPRMTLPRMTLPRMTLPRMTLLLDDPPRDLCPADRVPCVGDDLAQR
jgi:hypothetical protein